MKAFCTDVDQDPWDTPHRLVIRKLQASRGAVTPTNVPTVPKIVEALFPEGAPRESYPSDVVPKVPLFQMSELKLAAKRLDSGKAPGPDGIPNEVLRATIREKPQLILDVLTRVWEEVISRNNGNAKNRSLYRKVKPRIPRHYPLGDRYACLTLRVSYMRE